LRAFLIFAMMLLVPAASSQEPTPLPPLKDTDVVKLLVSKVSPARLRSLIEKYGIDFQVDPSLPVLTAAGADPDLIKALRAAEPAHETTTTPSVRPSPRATPARGRAPTPISNMDFALVGNGAHQVYLARREVTNREFDAYCARTKQPRLKAPPLGARLPNYPVVNVTWESAVLYCNDLSREKGRTYRLPTEVEWELAASAGNPRRTYPWGEEAPAGRACYGMGHMCAVASFKRNALGLFDMAGSAAEWVLGNDGEHVVKGGSWATPPENIRALTIANREKMDSNKASYEVGFRVAVEP
jgi:hypothetical protein